MTSLANKLVVEAIRATKYPFKTIVVGVFVFLGLMSYNLVVASTLSENFESYDVGQNVLELENWRTTTGTPVDYMVVKDTPVYTGLRATRFNDKLLSPNHNVIYDFLGGEDMSAGSLSVAFRTTGTTGSVDGLAFILADVDGSTGYIHFGYDRGNFGEIKYKSDNAWFLLGNYTGNNWFLISMEWEVEEGISSKIRYKLNAGDWTNWVNTPTNQKISPTYLFFQYYRWLNTKYWYIDDISIAGACSYTSCGGCENWFDCGVVGCCWYYNPYLPPEFTNYCASCVGYEECSYETCGACTNQGECEAVGCYWTGEYCSWIVSECGDGLACQFCETQETCEAEGCYWSTANQNCWYKAPTLPSSWSTYYDEHGGYEVPAEFVNDLAEATGKSFDAISSLFEGFAVSFSNSDALARGTALGQVIPEARGYLKIFDGLFGHIPIGETFVFILIFMLAIGLFRTIRHLIQIVKP